MQHYCQIFLILHSRCLLRFNPCYSSSLSFICSSSLTSSCCLWRLLSPASTLEKTRLSGRSQTSSLLRKLSSILLSPVLAEELRIHYTLSSGIVGS